MFCGGAFVRLLPLLGWCEERLHFGGFFSTRELISESQPRVESMTDAKRLPLLGKGRGGPMIGLLGRVLIYVILDVLVVTVVVLAKRGATLNVVPTVVGGDVASGALVGLVAYLFWRPRYKAAP